MPTIKPSVPKRNSSPTVTFLTQDELKRLVSTIKDKRDRAIILMAYRHGLRASEIGLLQRADIDLKQRCMRDHKPSRFIPIPMPPIELLLHHVPRFGVPLS
jgi:integrase